MQTRALAILASAMLASALAACAAPGARTSTETAQNASLPGQPACFWVRNVNDWTVLNDSELIVHAPLKQDAYLVKLFAPVFDLNFHIRLGFQDVEHTGQICNDSRDNLIIRGYSPPSVPIVAVRKLTMPEQAALLRPSGKNLASGQSNTRPR